MPLPMKVKNVIVSISRLYNLLRSMVDTIIFHQTSISFGGIRKKKARLFICSYARGRFTSNMDVKDTFQCMSSFGKWTILWDGDGEVANCLAENMTCIAKKAEKGNTHFKGDCTVN